ncbi:MAG: flagellar M-ring protein FliF, partial [Cyanobacteria bacterium REEB65]|nr:flagellar M-ring protein FliF [Cyanobacteria bacterium REEB65]
QQFGQTDAVQRLNMQRALQGELARTIESIAGVDNARVALAMPQQSLFSENDQNTQTTGTVMLKLRPGAQLTKDQAQTIVNFVAKSVPGLKAKDVIVADTMGRNYSQELNMGDEDVELSGSQLDIKRSFENSLRDNLQNYLDAILGPNGAVVQVQSEFDFNQVETNEKIFQPVIQTPDGTRSGLIRSQHESVEEYNGNSPGMAAGGVPGTTANIPTYQASDSASGGGAPGNYRKSDVTRNYSLNEEVKRIIKPPAELKRLSVSVALNGNIPASQVQSIQNIISAAAGIDPTRGDTLVVASVPFNDSVQKLADKEMQAEQTHETVMEAIKIAGAVLVGLIALLLLRRGLRTREEELFEQLPAAIEKPGITVAELGSVGEEDRKGQLQREISKVVKSQPQEVARLVRTWMLEDE